MEEGPEHGCNGTSTQHLRILAVNIGAVGIERLPNWSAIRAAVLEHSSIAECEPVDMML